jgi:hypothetical protein
LIVLSLDDGRVERTIDLNTSSTMVSGDVRWLTEFATTSSGAPVETDIIDLADGTVQARLADMEAVTFSPDSRYLLVNDQKMLRARLLDWRNGSETWSSPDKVQGVFGRSDPSTDKLLIAIVSRSAPAYTDGVLWIVASSGAASRFVPDH